MFQIRVPFTVVFDDGRTYAGSIAFGSGQRSAGITVTGVRRPPVDIVIDPTSDLLHRVVGIRAEPG